MSNAPRCNKDMTMTDAEGRRIGRQTQKITDARRNGTGVPDGTERGGGLGAARWCAGGRWMVGVVGEGGGR